VRGSSVNFHSHRVQIGAGARDQRYRRWNAALTTASGGEGIRAYNVSPGFFSVAQVAPLLGTAFSTKGELDSSHLVVSYRFWKNRLGADPNIIGRTLTINQSPYVVVAAMPRSFDFPVAAEAWAPLVFTPADKANRIDRQLGVFARLKLGVSVSEARQEMSAIRSTTDAAIPE
jgi:putative ABC transport system permease protein